MSSGKREFGQEESKGVNVNNVEQVNPIHTKGGPFGRPEYIFTFLAPLWSKKSAYTF